METRWSDETTDSRIKRELNLSAEGLSGFADAARDAFTNHKTETLLEAGGAAAVGIGLALVRQIPGIGLPISLAMSAGLLGASVKGLAENGTAAFGAFADNWKSADHWQANRDIVRKDVGKFAFDTAVMAGAGGLSAGLLRGFAGARLTAGLKGADSPSPSKAGQTPTDLSIPDYSGRANGRSSLVSIDEAIAKNDGGGESHWLQGMTAPRFPTLKGTVDADVAVVGGGTGSIIAAQLAAQGKRVVHVDAGRIVGENSTLSGMAGIATRYPDEAWSSIASELGMDKTRRFMELNSRGQKWLQDLSSRSGSFRPGSSFSVSGDLADLQNEAKFLASIDPHARLLGADELGSSIPGATAAIAIDNEGLIDPVRTVRSILEKQLIQPGNTLQVFENSPVLKTNVDSRVHLELPEGRIDADRVVFMTGVPSAELTGVDIPLIRKNVFALTANLDKGMMPPGAVFDDSTYTFYQPVGPRKILFGGAGTKIQDMSSSDTAVSKLSPLLKQYYPDATIDSAWTRQIAAAPDRRGAIDVSPRFGPKVAVATAFGGTGYMFTGLTPQILGPLLRGQAHPFPEAFGLDRPGLR